MIYETIHFQNSPAQVFPVAQNPFFEFLHLRLRDQKIYRILPSPSFGHLPKSDEPQSDLGRKGWGSAVLESFPVTETPLLVLASGSPRRRQLLTLTHWPFIVAAADVDESQLENESPADYVLRLAETKARAVSKQTGQGQIILAADTTVVDGTDLLGKPGDSAEAVEMLTRLRGHTHQVFTGIALLRRSDRLLFKDLCITDVPMRAYSDEEIQSYVQTGDPLDKAGAYAIQHPRFQPVAGMKGCYASVMGLPMCHVIRLMRKMEFQPNTDFFLSCETLLEYDCPVSRAILSGAV